jgi:hypothetical protein
MTFLLTPGRLYWILAQVSRIGLSTKTFEEVKVTIDKASESWGSFVLDTLPLPAQVRERGAEHPVTLADGHDATIDGREIPAGAEVITCRAGAIQDPNPYAEAEPLDIERSTTRLLAFRYGVHHCLGAPLTRVQGHIAEGSLLRRSPEPSPAVRSEDLYWSHGDGLVLRALSELPVIPGPALPRTDACGSARSKARA